MKRCILVGFLLSVGMLINSGLQQIHAKSSANAYVCLICNKSTPENDRVIPNCGCTYVCHEACLTQRIAYRPYCVSCNKKITAVLDAPVQFSGNSNNTPDPFNPKESMVHFIDDEDAAESGSGGDNWAAALDDLICTICLDDLTPKEAYTLSCACKYYYHKTCLKQWLVQNNTCPICRKSGVKITEGLQKYVPSKPAPVKKERCGLCLEKVSDADARKLSCGCATPYHRSCIEDWIKRYDRCPMCDKKKVTIKR